MFSRRLAVCVVLAAAVILNVRNSYPNGINPPRPSGAIVVKAACKDRSGGALHEIFRTRMMSGGSPVESITFVIQGVREQIDIKDIRTITLRSDEVNADGFANGYVVRSDRTEEREAKIQVKTNKAPLRLTGFSQTGETLSIDFATCESIEFSSVTSSNESRRPVMKE
jgi:hypothetical protein